MSLPRALCLLLLLPSLATAEWPFDGDDLRPRRPPASAEIGLRGGYDWDGDTYSAGGQARLPLWRRSRVILVPSGDLYNDGSGADWQANVDLVLSPGPRGGFYGGLGLGWVEAGGEREREVNQLLGLNLPLGRGRTRTYVEARWTERDAGTAFRIVFGLNLVLLRY